MTFFLGVIRDSSSRDSCCKGKESEPRIRRRKYRLIGTRREHRATLGLQKLYAPQFQEYQRSPDQSTRALSSPLTLLVRAAISRKSGFFHLLKISRCDSRTKDRLLNANGHPRRLRLFSE